MHYFYFLMLSLSSSIETALDSPGGSPNAKFNHCFSAFLLLDPSVTFDAVDSPAFCVKLSYSLIFTVIFPDS